MAWMSSIGRAELRAEMEALEGSLTTEAEAEARLRAVGRAFVPLTTDTGLGGRPAPRAGEGTDEGAPEMTSSTDPLTSALMGSLAESACSVCTRI